MADQNGSTAAVIADGREDAGKQIAEPVPKKPRMDDSNVEEKDFDKETQKALEEIDANQNEIDALNERKFICR